MTHLPPKSQHRVAVCAKHLRLRELRCKRPVLGGKRIHERVLQQQAHTLPTLAHLVIMSHVLSAICGAHEDDGDEPPGACLFRHGVVPWKGRLDIAPPPIL